MITQKIIENKTPFLILILILVATNISWDYFNGGVPVHYVLHNDDLPGFSNWWGLLTIPLSAFVILSIIQKRYKKNTEPQKISNITYGFLGGLFFGILLSILWKLNIVVIMPYLILLPMVMSFFTPVHQPEHLLGFILGMSYTFGGVLPIGIGLLLMFLSFLVWTIFRIGLPFIFKKIS